MCKKMLQGLFGGGAPTAAPPAKAEANYTEGKEGDVKGAVVTGGGQSSGSGTSQLSGGVVDDRKRKKAGVPGLGL